MQLHTAIFITYLIYFPVKTQIIYPDSIYFQDNYKPRSSPQINPIDDTNISSRYGNPEYERHVEEVVSNGISNLGLAINKFYLTHRGPDNTVFSPVNIAGALALILLGANGKTFDEIASVMGLATGVDIHSKSQLVHENLGRMFSTLEQSSDLTEQIKVAAAIFVQNGYPIRDLYRKISERIYRTEVVNLDFQSDNENAQERINAWVSSRTNGKIKSILAEPPPEETKIIITSALYFNGAWEKQFWEKFTRKRPFYPNGRRTPTNIEIDMMSNGGFFPYYKDTSLGCEIMGLPYKGNATMYVIIPQDSNVERLKSFESSLTSKDITRLIKSTDSTHSVILFPKMKLETTSDLSEPLQNLGVKSLFNPYQSNLALLSPGSSYSQHHRESSNSQSSFTRPPVESVQPARETFNRNDVLIFSRLSLPPNCTQIFNPNSNISECEEIDTNTQKQVTYKKFGDKLGRRVTRGTADSIDRLRMELNSDPHNQNAENPGLYVDQVLHKVYIDITERGTEAAASTSAILTRGGDLTIFRADIPFLFFIWHKEAKLILFWGAVYRPTPYDS